MVVIQLVPKQHLIVLIVFWQVKRIDRVRIGVGVGVIAWVGVRVTVGVRNMIRFGVEIRYRLGQWAQVSCNINE